MRRIATTLAVLSLAAPVLADEPMGIQQPGGVSMKEYVDRCNSDAKDAVAAATSELNRRLEGMNEFRAAMEKQQSFYASNERVNEIAKRVDRFEGRSEGKEYVWGIVGTIVGLVIGGAAVGLTVLYRSKT